MIAQPSLVGWQRAEILLLTIFAQVTLLALVGLLIAHRLGRRKPAAVQALPNPTTAHLAGDEDPHTTFRRLAGEATGRTIGDLTPLRGSADPAYLLFREDDTRRRLLLAAGDDLRAALRAEGVRRGLLSRRRYSAHALTSTLEQVAAAWMALAPRLDLPDLPPVARRWWLVELPPEELT